MEQSYFLGANTAAGFVSLYGGFCRGAGDYLRIVKGGPGTGKSGFMRAIAREAARRGFDVELVRCSGDPDSLDGVYIPALRLGWCDGTAPHAAEPGVFGADSDYVNLGQFCRTPLMPSDAARAGVLTEEYRVRYARAYALLAAAKNVEEALRPAPNAEAQQRAEAALCALVARLEARDGSGALSERFGGAVSCLGPIEDRSGIEGCRLVYACEDGCALASGALAAARDLARSRGLHAVVCLSPFDAQTLDALLLPELSTAFVRGTSGERRARRVGLDRLCGTLEEVKALRRQTRAARRERERCVAAACAMLAEAKALHDELESVYRPYMDFPSLDAFTAREIARVFC